MVLRLGTLVICPVSLFSTKNMTTGEGGMITSNNIDLSKLCSSIRNRGLDLDSSSEQFINIGSNSRMTEIQALLGIYQLKRIQEFNLHRNRIAEIYNQELNSFFDSVFYQDTHNLKIMYLLTGSIGFHLKKATSRLVIELR